MDSYNLKHSKNKTFIYYTIVYTIICCMSYRWCATITNFIAFKNSISTFGCTNSGRWVISKTHTEVCIESITERQQAAVTPLGRRNES